MLDIINLSIQTLQQQTFFRCLFPVPLLEMEMKVYTERTLLPTLRLPRCCLPSITITPRLDIYISSFVHIEDILALNGSSENSSAEHGYPISNFSSTLGCRIPSLPIPTSVPLPVLVGSVR